MAATPTLAVLEQCRVAPPQGTTAKLSLSLTFFDTKWWNFLPMHDLLFYEFPRSKAHFVEHIIPKLKESLSLALKQFLPVAGNLVCPSDTGRLGLHYEIGDSISVTFAESSDDINYLAGNQARNADRFYPLVPQLPPASVESSGKTKMPLFAVQVTVFPNSGACVAWSYRHVIGDASTVVGFLKAWGSIYKFSGDARLFASNSLPFYDRAEIQDPSHLDTLLFNSIKMFKPQESSPVTTMTTDKVRATFDISQADIQKLKNVILAKAPNLAHLSSFTVTCAYVWTCWLRSIDAIGDQKVDENEPEYFDCPVDFRARLDPPLPPTYFGNCVLPCIVASTHAQLVGNEGLVNAAILIGEAIHKKVNDKDGVLKGAWLSEIQTVAGRRVLGVAGSPKYDAYDVDFGWGKPEKYESIAIDVTEAVSLNKSRKFEGGLEFSLSLSKKRMDAFATIFTDGLKIL